MCGIVGIYLKTKKFEKNLGKMLSGMLNNMESRGPDSAGFAIYKNEDKKIFKYLKNAECFILTSLWEDPGFVLVESGMCNLNVISSNCPSGVATMDQKRYRVIDVADRSERVLNFHKNTVFVVKEMLEAAGLTHTHQLNRRHIVRRLSASQIKLADQIYPKVENGALLRGETVEDARLSVYWDRVDQSSFQPIN